MIVAIAYVGFPLLTLSYEFKPTSDWKMGQFVDVPTACSKAAADYSETLAHMRNTKNWMQGGLFMDAHDSTGVEFFQSVNHPQLSLNDPYDRPDWADGSTLVTSSMQSDVIGQLPHVVGALPSVSCGVQRYNLTDPVTKFDVGARSPLLVTLPETASESPQSRALACTDACFGLQADAHVPLSCVERRSTVTTMLSDFNFDLVGYSPFANCSWEGPNFSNTSIPHHAFKSGATSCIQQRDSSSESEATIQMAIREPESWTKVVTCNISVAFMETTVNTFDHKYLSAPSASAEIISSQASIAQLLNLTMKPFVNFFHQGPPHLVACPTTDGFNWISYANDNIDPNRLLDSDDAPTFPSASCAHKIQSSWAATLCENNAWRWGGPLPQWYFESSDMNGLDSDFHMAPETDIYQCRNSTGADATFSHYNNWLQFCWHTPFWSVKYPGALNSPASYLDSDGYAVPISLTRTNFTEAVFAKPLLHLLSQPGVFEKTAVQGVLYQADLQVSHGPVPYQLGITILFIPIIWTLGLSCWSLTQAPHWTPFLDSFAMFKLGADWKKETKHLGLTSCSDASDDLAKIPGTVFVDLGDETVRLRRTVRKQKPNGSSTMVREKVSSAGEL